MVLRSSTALSPAAWAACRYVGAAAHVLELIPGGALPAAACTGKSTGDKLQLLSGDGYMCATFMRLHAIGTLECCMCCRHGVAR